ncbi:MAG: toxin-antitoxin system protein [Armatimonadetes bacterium]|nr:toxin-antitoxin system protein [Armatimonadota bacterium]
MSSTLVRVSRESHSILKKLTGRTGESMQAILDKAIEVYRRQLFLEETHAAYALLKEDTAVWASVQAERELWDATLSDGLDPSEQWAESGYPIKSTEESR